MALVGLVGLWGCAERPLALPGGGGTGSSAGDGSGTGSGDGSGTGDGTGNGDGAGNGNASGDGNGQGGNGQAAPRLLSPLSTATVTSARPRLRWDVGGASSAPTVELCADRACAQPLGPATVAADGASATPDAPLPVGPVFWRVSAGGRVSATWELFVRNRDAPVDSSFGTTLDLDGDGRPEVAASAGGKVALYPALANGGVSQTPLVLADPDGGNAKTSGFGFVVASAGDVNGDGYGDLAVGSCGGATEKVVVYFGGADGAQAARLQSLASPDGKAGFGCRLAAAGDLDGDGYADLAVSRVGPDFSGGLYVFRGGPNGLTAPAGRIDSPNRKPSRLGYSLAGLGDVDGDGYADLAASEIDYSDLSGQVHLYRGGPDGLSNARVTSLASPDPSGLQFGSSVALAGDVDGDGWPDLLVGAAAAPVTTMTPAPRAHLYHGGPMGLGAGAAPLTIDGSGVPGFAFEVEGVGDLDGDGHDDVAVSSSNAVTLYRGLEIGAGRGYQLAAAGQPSTPRHLAGAGDLNDDGRDDLVVGDGLGLEVRFGGTPPGPINISFPLSLPPPAGATSFGAAVARRGSSSRRLRPTQVAPTCRCRAAARQVAAATA